MQASPDPPAAENQQQKMRSLQLEIESYRAKISHYQKLQQELNDISSSIIQPSQSALVPGKSPSGRKVSEESKSRRSSNKKIKMYELQKKLKKLVSEFKQKQSSFGKEQKRERELLTAIENKSKRIEEEKQSSQSLKDLQIKIARDIDFTDQKIEREVEALEESVKTKEMFNFQRRKMRDQLRRLRTNISRVSQQGGELELSLSAVEEGELDNQTEEGWLIADDNRGWVQGSGWVDRERNRIQTLMTKIDLYRQRNSESLNCFYAFKTEFTGNEILAKHHRMTIELQSSQLKTYEQMILSAKDSIASMGKEAVEISQQVQRVEGDRGYLRGRVGIVIEEQRLVKGVNVLLERDSEELREKLSRLRLLGRLFDKIN